MNERVGRQTPTFEHVGKYASSEVEECASMFAQYGFNLMAWQIYQLRLMLAVTAMGMVAAKSLCFSVPRQNGKSFAARLYAIWMALIHGRHVLYSAHQGKTVRKFFTMLLNLFDNPTKYPDFADSVEKIYRQQGAEGIYFKNGGYIEFSTRTNSGARGDSIDICIIDEAQEYTSAMQAAIKPILSAGPHGDSQTIYIGTPPDPTCRGDVWKDMHDKAHSDKPGRVWWIEWALEGDLPVGLDVDELFELAWEYNPGMGGVLNELDIYDEADTMKLDAYARERLGWWGHVQRDDAAFTKEEWESALVAKAPDTSDAIICYGIKFSPDDREVALTVAVRTLDEQKNKHIYVELRDVRSLNSGTNWIVSFLAERIDRTAYILIDGRNGAENLRSELVDAGYTKSAVDVASTGDAINASSNTKELIRQGRLTHPLSPVLDDSATQSVKRMIGKAGGYSYGDGDGDGDACPISSAALAAHAAYTTKRNPQRKARLLGFK